MYKGISRRSNPSLKSEFLLVRNVRICILSDLILLLLLAIIVQTMCYLLINPITNRKKCPEMIAMAATVMLSLDFVQLEWVSVCYPALLVRGILLINFNCNLLVTTNKIAFVSILQAGLRFLYRIKVSIFGSRFLYLSGPWFSYRTKVFIFIRTNVFIFIRGKFFNTGPRFLYLSGLRFFIFIRTKIFI